DNASCFQLIKQQLNIQKLIPQQTEFFRSDGIIPLQILDIPSFLQIYFIKSLKLLGHYFFKVQITYLVQINSNGCKINVQIPEQIKALKETSVYSFFIYPPLQNLLRIQKYKQTSEKANKLQYSNPDLNPVEKKKFYFPL
ncbi:hypothetical protein IMG5_104250, partial [Ichthyophthirius multifiliis]